MYVCAIPVGHPVIPSSSYPLFFSVSLICVLLFFSELLLFSVILLFELFVFSSSASSIIFRNSSFVFAFNNFFLNFSSINKADKRLKTSRCKLSLLFGAAIKNSSFIGFPSNESKSTPSGITIAASPGSDILSPFPCGMAISSPTPVEPSSSLFITNFKYSSLLFMFPLYCINSTAFSITSFLFVAFTFKSIASFVSKSVIFITFYSFLKAQNLFINN